MLGTNHKTEEKIRLAIVEGVIVSLITLSFNHSKNACFLFVLNQCHYKHPDIKVSVIFEWSSPSSMNTVEVIGWIKMKFIKNSSLEGWKNKMTTYITFTSIIYFNV